jgi:enamine deaminase RidA (YjgF/YER057c/UK114 family)
MVTNIPNSTAEQRLKALGIELPQAPTPLGAYVEAVQTGNLLFLSGVLPTERGTPKFVGRIGETLTLDDGRRACQLATLNALAMARAYLTSLDRVNRVVRLAVSLVTSLDFTQHAGVADAASELLLSLFGPDKTSTRMVYGPATLPAGVCAIVELTLEVSP